MIVTQKLASFLTTLRSIVLSLVFLVLIAWNFGAINTSAKEVLGMVSHIQQLEASGLKVVLRDDTKLKANVNVADATLSEPEKRATVEAAQKLTGVQAERLFTIVSGTSHCQYSLPTPQMMLYLYIDVALKDLGLVKFEDDAFALENETARIAGHGSDIGKALSCYSMSLTRQGANVKSALVGIIRQQLG
jgi:hypothetical protein